MVRAEAGTGSSGLRPRPRSRFQPPHSGTAPAPAGWADLTGDGSSGPLLDTGNVLDETDSEPVAAETPLPQAKAGRRSGRTSRRPLTSAAGTSDEPLASLSVAGPGPVVDDRPQPVGRSGTGRAGGHRTPGSGSDSPVEGGIPAVRGPLLRARSPRGARAADPTHDELASAGALSGSDERATGHHRAASQPTQVPRTHRAIEPGPRLGSPGQATDLDTPATGSDLDEGVVWDATPPRGALLLRPARLVSSVARRRPAGDEAAGGGYARGEREVTVQVSIGRIEVRVAHEAPASRGDQAGTNRPAIRPGLVTLEEYSVRRGAQR